MRKMRNILKNRLALSTVITTLIILVVSVLLAGVVTYFAINVVSTRSQQESLELSFQHVWVPSTGASEAAIMITNTGGRDVVIQQIQVRGQTVAWTDTFYAFATTGDTLTTDLTYIATVSTSSTFGGLATAPTAGTTELTLPASGTVVVYIISPDSVGLNDIGTTVGFTVFTSQAMYYKEANVQAA